jgi:hypothetical protein
MKREQIDSKAHVWRVTRGTDGKLRAQIDAALLAELRPELTPAEIADLLLAAGEAEIARSRLW